MDYQEINDEVKAKVPELKARLISRIRELNMKHVDSRTNYEKLTDIKIRTSSKFGLTNRIRIQFKRSGVFAQKGVGRATTAAQAGSTARQPKDWFNSVVEDFANELAEEVADLLPDVIFNSIQIN